MASVNEPREESATRKTGEVSASGEVAPAPRVRNAQVRFAEHEVERGTAGRISQKIKRKDGAVRHRTRRTSSKYERVQHKQAISNEIINYLSTEGVGFLEDEVRAGTAKKEPLPSFPFIMFSLALVKDIIDVPGEISIIGIILTTALSFVIALVLFFWFLGKMSGKWWKGKTVSWFWRKYIIAMAIEFTPFGKVIPATIILVLMAHYRETKIVKIFNGALERLHSAKFKFDFE